MAPLIWNFSFRIDYFDYKIELEFSVSLWISRRYWSPFEFMIKRQCNNRLKFLFIQLCLHFIFLMFLHWRQRGSVFWCMCITRCRYWGLYHHHIPIEYICRPHLFVYSTWLHSQLHSWSHSHAHSHIDNHIHMHNNNWQPLAGAALFA